MSRVSRIGATRCTSSRRAAIVAWSAAIAACAVVMSAVVPADESPATLEAYLRMKEIDVGSRAALVEGAWSDDKERVLARVLTRLAAPSNLVAAWRADAVEVPASGTAADIADRLVKVRGRATFVAPRVLPAELAELAGRPQYDVVRLVDDRGAVVDAVVPRAPRIWPRGKVIDEPAAVVGLPLTTGPGPEPVAEGDAAAWPAVAHDLLVAATAVEWRPTTLLGSLGMDYGLFDSVVDDRKLEPGDSPAFWGVLEAATRVKPEAIAAAAGSTDVLAMIDPAQKWFATHRGEPVVIAGTARRATRIVIDDPAVRAAVGGDHYWELEVFVDTPTIKVNDRVQDRYPIVCCVRSLTEGMPSGEDISERVRVPGFAFKRYSYPLRDVFISSSQGDSEIKGERISTPLVIGPRAEWQAPPSPATTSNVLFWIFSAIIGVLALLLASNGWAMGRDARRAERLRRESLPDRLDLPNE
jgi:hypothetical protein